MRNLKVNTIVIATMALALVVAGIPGTAEAGVCSEVGKPSGCVNSKDVKDNRLRAQDLLDEAGADFASGEQSVLPLSAADTIVRSVTITAPTAGRVIVNTSGTFGFGDNAVAEFAECEITTGAVLDFTHTIVAVEAVAAGYNHLPFGGTRGFDVAAGSTTFNLVCDGSATTHVDDTSLTGNFVSTAY